VTLFAQKVVFHPSIRPGRQRINLPFEPRALMCWWSPRTDRVGSHPNFGGIGFASPGAAVAHAWVSESGRDRTRAACRLDDAAVVVFDAVDADPALHATLGGFDARGFMLEWRVARELPVVVHCLAIGGDDVTASAGRCVVPTAPATQPLHVMGLRPDLVLLAATPCAEPGRTTRGLVVSFGAAAAGSGQAAAAFASADGAEPGTVGGCQRAGAVIAVPRTDDSKDAAALARVASYDAEGITLAWSSVASVRSAAYLAVSGGVFEVGEDMIPARRRTRTTLFKRTSPQAVAAFTWGLTGGDDTRHIARLSIGALSSRSAVGSAAWGEKLAKGAPSHTLALSSGSLIQVPDTRAGATALHADGKVREVRAGGVVLEWPVAEGGHGGPRQFIYVALGERLRPWRRSVLRRAFRGLRRRTLRDVSGSVPADAAYRRVAGAVDEHHGRRATLQGKANRGRSASAAAGRDERVTEAPY
jgi:hypothetical protein